jgi:hypothetical protein
MLGGRESKADNLVCDAGLSEEGYNGRMARYRRRTSELHSPERARISLAESRHVYAVEWSPPHTRLGFSLLIGIVSRRDIERMNLNAK